MSNWSNESEAREQIKTLVAEYYKDFKKPEQDKEFTPGDRISYASRVYDEKEMMALTDATLDFWLTTGRFSDQFEKEFADWIGVKYAHLVNSGSSANLIAFMALTAPELGDRQIKKGDEVITVACGFPTTVTPAIQYGAVPVFVDVTVPQYNIDVAQLEAALSPKTKAVMIAHTLGNPFDLKHVREFCNKHNLWLVEDNCDALGTKYTIDGETRFSGTWGDIGTSSFYPPHHMTMGEGGCVYTNNPELHRLILSFRDWGRDCICPSGQDNFCKHRFDGQYGELPVGYDHKYVYKTLVTTGKSGGHYVFVIPIEEEIDFKKAAKVVGEKSLEMLHLKELTKVTGYVRGGCTSIGMKKQFPTVIQEDAKELEHMHVSGGKLGMQLTLLPEDLAKAANAQFADVIHKD